MIDYKFVIPQKVEDLLKIQDSNIYYVNDELTLLETVQVFNTKVWEIEDDPLRIGDDFVTFFSVVRNFDKLDSQVRNRALTLIYRASNTLRTQLENIFNVLDVAGDQENRANVFESVSEKMEYSNSLKMLLFLNCCFIQLFEDGLSSKTQRKNFNESVVENDLSFKEYDKYKERIMANLLKLILFPLGSMTDSSAEAKEVTSQVMKVAYKMIENYPINGLARNKALLDVTFSIIGCGVGQYNQSLGFCLKLIQLLQYREQVAPLLADLVAFIVQRYDQKLLISQILREIERIDVRNLSHDSSCPRAISTFLTTLSDKCPQEFVPSVDHLFDYLEEDPYIMRNATLSVMANIIVKHLRDREDDYKLRDELLDALLNHIQDNTGYTRTRALAIWAQLCENNSIPLTYLVRVIEMAVRRFKDKSCFVRRSAVKLVITLLNRNPFAKKLRLAAFVAAYEVERENLKRLLSDDECQTDGKNNVVADGDDSEKENGSSDKENNEKMVVCSENNDESDVEEAEPERIPKSLIVGDEESELVKTKRKIDFLRNAIGFVTAIHKAIPHASDMLTSKNITDTQEAIDFFVNCHEFGIDEALVGFKKMMMLMYAPEKTIKDAVSAAYKKIFFESSHYDGKKNRDSLVVGNFINFVQNATLGELMAMKILLAQFHAAGDITKSMEHELWARFTRVKRGVDLEEAIASIKLLGMLASTEPEIIKRNLPNCVQYGLSTNGCTDQESRLVRETCTAIRNTFDDDTKRPVRLSKDNEIFVCLERILVSSILDLNSKHWYGMCNEAIKVIMGLSENSNQICDNLYRKLAKRVTLRSEQPNPDACGPVPTPSPDPGAQQPGSEVQQAMDIELTCSQRTSINGSSQINTKSSDGLEYVSRIHPIIFARFIHFLGTLALSFSVFLERDVLAELRRRKDSTGDGIANASLRNISMTSRRRSMRYGGNKAVDEQDPEDDVGLAGAEAEDADAEYIARVCDEELVCGTSLLGNVSKVVINVVTNPDHFSHIELKLASSMTLAKFMIVSAKFCSKHLRLLFTILERTNHPEVKEAVLVALHDLCIRFPNLLDGWTGKIFDNLQSEVVSVRRTALKVLTRLVLGDMIKAKDHISRIANLIVDDDTKIAQQARYFFLELSKRPNGVYNALPEIIARLSDASTGISEPNFRFVMKFLFELIDKSHQIDSLVDKLCSRFMDTDNERQWADLAYCLSLLKYSDKTMTTFMEKFEFYKDKLCVDSVKESITSIVTSYRTPQIKEDMRRALDEFEAKISKAVGEAVSQDDGEQAPEQPTDQMEVDENQDETLIEDKT